MDKINDLILILSKFLRVAPGNIDDDTVINSSVMQGSVLFHRMISRVNDLYSIEINDYTTINTFKDLLKIIKESSN